MTDHTSARADEVLTELVELVETARTLPMSSSCVVPRERTLDLLDELREVLPPEVQEARRIVAQQERILTEAAARAQELHRSAAEQVEATLATARAQAHSLIEDGQAEQARLVSSAGVHQAATSAAARVAADAESDAARMRTEAQHYAAKLRGDAHDYAERTLSELVGTLQRLAGTAENGRIALERGREPGTVDHSGADLGPARSTDPSTADATDRAADGAAPLPTTDATVDSPE
jgi:cell division septum initiation protein DivIVA